MLRSYPRGL